MSGSGLYTAEEIYRLLPAVYRVRDAEQGGVLRELVGVITDQVNVLAESLEQMYDDEFVETCAPWVAPYIGDLVGYRTLHGVVPQIASPRANSTNVMSCTTDRREEPHVGGVRHRNSTEHREDGLTRALDFARVAWVGHVCRSVQRPVPRSFEPVERGN